MLEKKKKKKRMSGALYMIPFIYESHILHIQITGSGIFCRVKCTS